MFGRRKSKKSSEEKHKADKKKEDPVTSSASPETNGRGTVSRSQGKEEEALTLRSATSADSRRDSLLRYHQDTIDSGFSSKADSNLNLASSQSSLHQGEMRASEPEMTSSSQDLGQWPRSAVRASMKKAYGVYEQPSHTAVTGGRPASSPLPGQVTRTRRAESMFVPGKTPVIRPEAYMITINNSNSTNNNDVPSSPQPQPVASDGSPKKHKKGSKKEEKLEKLSKKSSFNIAVDSNDNQEGAVDAAADAGASRPSGGEASAKKSSSFKLRRSASDHQNVAKGKQNKEQQQVVVTTTASVPHQLSQPTVSYSYVSTPSPLSSTSSLSPQMSFGGASGVPPGANAKSVTSPAPSFNLPRPSSSISDSYNFLSVDTLCAASPHPSPTRRLTNGDISLVSRDFAQPMGATRRYSASGWMPLKSSPLLIQRQQPQSNLGPIVETTSSAASAPHPHQRTQGYAPSPRMIDRSDTSPPPPLPPRIYQNENPLPRAPPTAAVRPVLIERQDNGVGKRDGYADLLRKASARRYSEEISFGVRPLSAALQASRGEPSISRRMSLDRDVAFNGRVAAPVYRRPSSAIVNSDLDLREERVASPQAAANVSHPTAVTSERAAVATSEPSYESGIVTKPGSTFTSQSASFIMSPGSGATPTQDYSAAYRRSSIARMSTGDSGYIEDSASSQAAEGSSTFNSPGHQYSASYQRNADADARGVSAWNDGRRQSVPVSDRYDCHKYPFPAHSRMHGARPFVGNVVYDTRKNTDWNIAYAGNEFSVESVSVQRRHSYCQQPRDNAVSDVQLSSPSLSSYCNGDLVTSAEPPASFTVPHYRDAALASNIMTSGHEGEGRNQSREVLLNNGTKITAAPPTWTGRRSVPAAVVVATRRVPEDCSVGQGQGFHEDSSTAKCDYTQLPSNGPLGDGYMSSIQSRNNQRTHEASQYGAATSCALPTVQDKRHVFTRDTARSVSTNQSNQRSYDDFSQAESSMNEAEQSFKDIRVIGEKEQVTQPTTTFEQTSWSPVRSVAVVHGMPALPANAPFNDFQFSNNSEEYSEVCDQTRELAVEGNAICDDQQDVYTPAGIDDSNGWLETERVMLAVSRERSCTSDSGSAYSRQGSDILPKFDEEYSLISGNKASLTNASPTLKAVEETDSALVSEAESSAGTARPVRGDVNLLSEESTVTPLTGDNVMVSTRQSDVQDSDNQEHDNAVWADNSEVVLEYTQRKVEHFDGQTLNLRQQIEANDALGLQVEAVLAQKLPGRDVDKCQAYLSDLRMVSRLLINLRTRLSQHRATASHSPADKKRGDVLQEKYEDAENLRASVERRGSQVKVAAQRHLTDEENRDFERYAASLPALLLQQAELEEKVKHGRHDNDVLFRVFDDERFEVNV